MTLRLHQLAVAMLLGVALTGCRSSAPSVALQRFAFQQPHMGTLFTITLYAPDESVARAASEAAFAKIAALERIMTDYDPESELMRLCQQPAGQPVHVSAELFEVLSKAQRMAELSDGAFDCTIGPVIRLWRRTRRTEELPAPELLARAQAAVGWRKLRLDAQNQNVTLTAPNMQLDLGGLGKGFAADKALAVLEERGITRALVAASGDIAAGESPPGKRGWRVGIGALDSLEGPPMQVLLLRRAAVSTSGDSEQFVEIGGRHFSHVVDPHTGLGLTNRLQVTVVARYAVETDPLSTTVRVLGAERGLKLVDGQAGLAALLQFPGPNGLEVVKSARWDRLPTGRRERVLPIVPTP